MVNQPELWFFPAIIALIFNGITTFLPKISLRSLKLLDLIVYHAFFFFLSALFFAIVMGDLATIDFNPRALVIAMAGGIIGTLGQLLYLYALQRGPLTQISMISSLYPLVATLLAFAVLKQPLTPRQIAGILLGIASIIVLVTSRDRTA